MSWGSVVTVLFSNARGCACARIVGHDWLLEVAAFRAMLGSDVLITATTWDGERWSSFGGES